MQLSFAGRKEQTGLSAKRYLLFAGKTTAFFLLFLLLLIVPYSAWWLSESGDVSVERAVSTQAAGSFALFGSGVSQDFVDYKLQLYNEVRPEIVAIGSSRVMQFRSRYFSKKFLNMGGVAGNLPVLRSTLDAMLCVHKPEAIILGLDFWWFMPTWNRDPFMEEPPTSGSYTYSIEALKKPWLWLLEGKISFADFLAPWRGFWGEGFRKSRFGIMAQQTDDGFGPDGSWYNTAEATGQKKPFDYRFRDTMTQIVSGSKAFYHVRDKQQAPSQRHLDAFAEIYCRIQSRGIRTFVFIAPLAEQTYQAMRERESLYPHLFTLADALKARGINVLDLTDPRRLASGNCEFLDGFHGGEITYVRVLRSLCDQWSALLNYVDLDAVQRTILQWQGHTMVHDERVTSLWEKDVMDFGCPKKTSLPQDIQLPEKQPTLSSPPARLGEKEELDEVKAKEDNTASKQRTKKPRRRDNRKKEQ
ncbi:MAG: hypothetical protein J5803_05295 [Desulfovibrio sp.]|nr:hypothetical protein [Desulfovibrio sp.]